MSVSELSSTSTLIHNTSLDGKTENEGKSQVETNSKFQFYSDLSVIPLEDSYKDNKSCALNDQDEKELVKALDLRIMPLFCLFYFADSLDRANIGNAT